MRARTSSPWASAVQKQQHGACPARAYRGIAPSPSAKDHRLVVAGSVGQADDAHLVAGLGAPLRRATPPWRRPCRRSTPVFTARENSAQDCTRRLLSTCGVIVERMAGEEEADRLVFAPQPLRRQPRLDLRACTIGSGAAPRRRTIRSGRCVAASWARCARASTASIGREGAGAVRLELVERAGGGETFQHALVDRARIDAPGEVGEVGERALARAPRRSPSTACAADALERRKRIMDGVARRRRNRRRSDSPRAASTLMPRRSRLGAEFGELVGIAHVERHRRRQELDRIVRLHIGRLVGDAARKAPNAILLKPYSANFAQASKIVRRAPCRCRARPRRRRNGRAAPPSPP